MGRQTSRCVAELCVVAALVVGFAPIAPELDLNEGAWDGQQVIPADWVAESTAERFETVWGPGCGYQWWTWQFGGYAAHGHGGQCLFVVPDLDLLAVTTGAVCTSVCELLGGLVEDYIIPAAESTSPSSRTGRPSANSLI